MRGNLKSKTMQVGHLEELAEFLLQRGLDLQDKVVG
jgi:hypothetical protein